MRKELRAKEIIDLANSENGQDKRIFNISNSNN